MNNGDGLTLETAQELFLAAGEIFRRQPWKVLNEEELLLVPVEGGPLCFCSVMGARGEYFAVVAYTDAEVYDLFRRVHAQQADQFDFYWHRRGVFVEYGPAADLEKPDKEFLRALGHPCTSGSIAPSFRSCEPGVEDWYVGEEAGRILTQCLCGFAAFLDHYRDTPDPYPWADSDTYPAAILVKKEKFSATFRFDRMEAPPAPKVKVEAAPLDTGALEQILRRDLKRAGVIELDVCPVVMPIGRRGERRTFPLLSMACSVETGVVLSTELFEQQGATYAQLQKTLLNAISSSGFIPREVRVRRQEFAEALKGVAMAIGFRLQLVAGLDAIDEARTALLDHMAGRR